MATSQPLRSPDDADPPARGGRSRGERTRSAILESAETLFAERGFAATRLEDVAERVGIRRASIVYHFRDKTELYDAVLADVFGGLFVRIEAALEGPGGLGAGAERAVSAWIDYVAGRPSLARLLLREVADGTAEQTPALLRHLAPFTATIARILRETDPGDPLHDAPTVDPVHLASTIAGSTVFFVVAMPTLLPGVDFDPFETSRLEAHRTEVLGVTRRLLGLDPATDRAGGSPATDPAGISPATERSRSPRSGESE